MKLKRYEDKDVIEGELLVLVCENTTDTQGFNNLSYRWEKDGQVVASRGLIEDYPSRHYFESGPYGIGLILSPLSMEHAGTYACIASTEEDGDLFETTLNVHVSSRVASKNKHGAKAISLSGSANGTRVLDLDNHGHVSCQGLPPYPVQPIEGTTGDLLGNGQVLVCGGGHPDIDIPNMACYFLNDTLSTVQATLSMPRNLASSITVGPDNGALWITGGKTDNVNSFSFSFVASTEIVRPGVESKPGPDLPREGFLHCLLRINDTTAMFIDVHGKRDTFYMDLDHLDKGGSWTAGSPIPEDFRSIHLYGCGVFRDKVQEDLSIVAAIGGRNVSKIMIQFQDSKVWQLLEVDPMVDLEPIGYYRAVYNTYGIGDGLYVIGHYEERLMFVRKLECSNRKCHWQKESARLLPKFQSHGNFAMIDNNDGICSEVEET